MASTNKSASQENQKKPTFVALIKKNKPDPPPESSPKPEETLPKKTSSQSRGKKSTDSTTKSKSTTTSTSSKAQEKTTPQTNPKTTQSKTNIKAKRQSPSTSEPKVQGKTQLTTTPKSQNQSPTYQHKNTPTDPIQKALLYKNKKKQRLGISDYQDQISARDISLSITGITSVAAGSLLQTFLAGSVAGLFSFPALLLLAAAFAKNVFEFNRTAADIQREEDAEKKIAQLLKDTYLENGGEIHSLLDENPLVIPDPEGYRQDYLDIGLFLPSGQFLAISVKSLKGEKDFVFFDNNTNTLRYRNCHGKKKWNVYPIDELKRQMEWLNNNLQIFKHPPIGIITLTAPTTVKVFDNVAYQIGELEVLKVDNIYVVEEKDLLDFIDKVSSREKV